MKKLIFVIITLLCVGCSYTKYKKHSTCNDSIIIDSIIIVEDTGKFIRLTLDSFLAIKDSLICVKEEYSENDSTWMTREKYKWMYEFPDTITVAFTRNGKFEDSVKAVRQWEDLYDNNGKKYSPSYVFGAVVGDTWIYDINGKFIKFNCSSFPHSGKPHHYKP